MQAGALRALEFDRIVEAVRGFAGGYANLFVHELVSFFHSFRHEERSLEDGPWFEKRFDPERAKFAAYA